MLMNSNRIAMAACTECTTVSKTKFNIFSFSGKKSFRVLCDQDDCANIVWEIHEIKDKYKITLHCPVCDEIHSYTMSKRNFWSKKFFSFNCTAWNIAILYISESENNIDDRINMQNDDISEMLGDFINADDNFVIMYDLIECINDLAKTNNVKCGCDTPDVTMLIEDNKIILKCKNCNSQKIINATEKSIDDIMKTSTLVLDDTNLNSNKED